MAPVYGGLRTGLQPGDIAGIQAIYGARSPDSYQSQGIGTGFASAIDVSSSLAAANQAIVGSVSLATIGDTEYYSFVAPSYASGAIQVTGAASDISMLSPEVSLYDASGSLLAQSSNPAAWSDNVIASVPTVTPGQRYYIAVTGATHDYFDVGAYKLIVSLPQSSPLPPVTPQGSPNLGSPPQTPPQSPSVIAPQPVPTNTSLQKATRLGRVLQTSVTNLNFSSGAIAQYFYFQTAWTGAYQVNAPGTLIQVLNTRGRLVAQGVNQVSIPASRPGSAYYIKLSPAARAPVSGINLSVGRKVTIVASKKITKPRHLDVDYSAVKLSPGRKSRAFLSTFPRQTVLIFNPLASTDVYVLGAVQGTIPSLFSTAIHSRLRSV
jgi:hypothetical protein